MFALVDCNNFYASCERVFAPQLARRAVIVLSNNDGCVVARSNEAKALGFRMGEPAFQKQALIDRHRVAVFSSNYALYGDMSERVMNTLAAFAPAIEIYSIDEAFLDLRGIAPPALPRFAAELRRTVMQWTGIPVSIGIAPTKTLAKAANRIAKKQTADGVFVLENAEQIEAVLETFPVEDIWGIGGQYCKFLNRHGIFSAGQLRQANDAWIKQHLTIVGLRLVQELRGVSCLALETAPPAKKNICTSRSFGTPVESYQLLEEAVATFAARCAEKLRRQNSHTNLVSVFIHTNPFKPEEPQYNHCQTLQLPVASNSTPELIRYALSGLKRIYRSGHRYKKAGVLATGIVPAETVQGSLFDTVDREKHRRLMEVTDRLNHRMGRDTLQFAVQGFAKSWGLRQERLSPGYTTRWEELMTVGANAECGMRSAELGMLDG